MIENAKARCKDPHRLNPMPQRFSNESFFDCLVPHEADSDEVDCLGFLYASELSSIANKNSYMEELPDILTDIYDCCPGEYDPESRTVRPGRWRSHYRKDAKGGGRMLRNPGLTMLACTTPTHFREKLPAHIRTTGFLSRLLVVYTERTDRPPNSLIVHDPAWYLLKERLTDQLALATEMEGQVVMTPETSRAYEQWYLREYARRKHIPPDSVQAAFAGRASLHTLRLATIFAGINQLGRPVRDRTIPMELPHFESATKWIAQIEDALPEACGDLAQQRWARLEDRLLIAIDRFGRGRRWAAFKDIRHYTVNNRRDDFNTADVVKALERLMDLKKVEHTGGKESFTEAKFRRVKPRPGPWTGTPAQKEPSEEYIEEAQELLEQDKIAKEVAAGMRDRWGNLLH
jgi:hypothetical protein